MTDEVAMGVPVARSMAKHLPPAEITRPTVAMLIQFAKDINDLPLSEDVRAALSDSLFPEWLDVTGTVVQEQPYSYRYAGQFPMGRWECEI
tara:strand:- start:7042 stop:7314 length:273 start_codon:yes stop_codon:yes gene_type:complete